MENETKSRKLSDKQNCPCYGQNIEPIESKVLKHIILQYCRLCTQNVIKGCYIYLKGPCIDGQQNFSPNRKKYKLEIKQRESCDNIDTSYLQAGFSVSEEIFFRINNYTYYDQLRNLPKWETFFSQYRYALYQKGIRGESIQCRKNQELYKQFKEKIEILNEKVIFLSNWPKYNAYYNQIHDLNDYKRIVENEYDCPGKIELQYVFESLEGRIQQNMEISRKVYTLMTALPIQFFVFFILLCFGISLLYKFILKLYKIINFKQVWGKIIYYVTCKKNDKYLKKLEQEKILKQIQEENKKKNQQLQKKQQQEQKQNLEKVKIYNNIYQEQPKFQKENQYQCNNKEQDNYNMEDNKIQEFQFQTEEALMSQQGNLHEYYKQEDIIQINNQNDNNFYNQQKYFWPQQQDYPLYPLQSQYYEEKYDINQYNNQHLYKKHDKNINNDREKDGKQQFKNQKEQKFSIKQIKLQQSKLDSNQGDMINVNPLIEFPQDQISSENSERKFNITKNSNNKNKLDLQKPYNPFESKQLSEQNGGEIDEKKVNPYLIQNDKSLMLNYNKQKQAQQKDFEIKRLESINIDYKEENKMEVKK
ncbi:hypothetical protein PPERSA_09122 [Pseudocohnilembus persalinus]|uniref:Transmembrane protein n=1 Tax=Pseudocohnilembus persalinus TaxID=266149 RepID=A0A0V0QXG4_PSEPJ|nr:hypothetical protein PPERSA_09122 [Pseudocohnilembus persalinus]|eukprot:KRX06720.1 hypothetical protein PPERSA_09122 [Pseudocohnilembus persalinus]